MQTNQPEDKSKKTMMAAIVALILVAGVALYFAFSGHRDNHDLTVKKAIMDSVFANLSDTMDVREAQLEQISDKNTQLDSLVAASQLTIEAEKKEISVLLGKAKLTKDEIAQAQTMITQYGASISDLQNRLTQLTIQNEQLTQANQKLTADLTAEKKTTSDLNATNQNLRHEMQQAMLLQLVDVDVNGIKEKPNGKEVTVRHARAVESLRVSFETGLNKILPNGPLTLYVRIINPKGETIAITGQGSGSLKRADNGTRVQYTKKAEITWDKTNKKVLVYCKQDVSSQGIYKVEIYQAGYLIGNGEVKLD